MSHDVHSYSRPEEAVVKHLSLNLTVDFNKKTLQGTATLAIDNRSGGNVLMLDSRGLNIQTVVLDGTKPTTFELGKADPILGQPLKINIEKATKTITVTYSTSPEAAALQWLNPEQTEGGKHPFLFTQSQAILARTWIPLQDSPGIKFTYDATISVPPGLMALMSAENDTNKHADGVYTFQMPQPVPSYLMALAVGNLNFHAYDNRCGVFAEPELIQKAAWEFEDLPKMIESAEALYGPYAWGRYDVLVLPPSFPFGGMENPRVTFATPTIIAGDRSLVSLVAHELAHSWSGNLVTNATWNDFWLNEGFTVYFETRIMEKIYGKDYADMLTLLSLMDLKETIAEMGDTSRETHLYADLAGRDPDDGVSDIAYEKGRFFLTTIEMAVGREKWDAFLNGYFKKFAFGTMDTKHFVEYLNQELIKGDTALEAKIRINDWIYGPGLPSNCPVITSKELDKAGAAATAFLSGTPAGKIDTSGWTTHHWLYFIRTLGDRLNADNMQLLDNAFHLTQSGNSEILCEWLLHAIKANYKTAFPALDHFLCTVGRRKFVKPLFTEMVKTPDGKQMAQGIYKKARPGYHTVTVQTIDTILGL
ncbi:MAG TPA: M1 family metallopeptidase [Bacteroidia bacterium]|nr:M1 family metallopeptidase [Bacteroidia bacterium]